MRGRRPAARMMASEAIELLGLAARRCADRSWPRAPRSVRRSAPGTQTVGGGRPRLRSQTVRKWRNRFLEQRIDGLHDEPRSGAPRSIDDARIEQVIVRTLESVPPDATHWSSRCIARASGLSVSTCSVSGARSACSRTAWRRSSSRPIRTFWPRFATWSASTWIRRIASRSGAQDGGYRAFLLRDTKRVRARRKQFAPAVAA